MANRILSIDPGGKTGLYFTDTDSKKEQFLEINSPWKETYQEIKQLIAKWKVNLVLYENINFINHRSKDSLNLIRLLGAIECLTVKKVESMNVLKVKEMSKALFAGKIKIPELEYLPGRGKGWMWKGKWPKDPNLNKGERISIHCLEAYLVWYLWNKQ